MRPVSILMLLLCGIACASPALAKLPRWDAAPAMEVLHLQGEHAGEAVCPMCRYGYDAGVLALLPASIAAGDAAAIAGELRRSRDRIGDGRFRAFLVFLGAAPSAQVLAAVRSEETGWYVGWMPADAVREASAGFAMDLNQITAEKRNAYAYVFAQRRVIWAFPPQEPIESWATRLDQHADYAMDFLQAHYPQPVAATDPDLPRGALWLAPAHLTAVIDLEPHAGAEGAGRALRRAELCLVDAQRVAQGWALVTAHRADALHDTDWARSDERGCLQLAGSALGVPLRLQVSRTLRPAQDITLAPLAAGERRVQVLEDRRETVSGNEPVVGACEGCEAVFVGMPDALASSARMAPPGEAGAPLRLHGTARDATGAPRAGVVVYAYQTDAQGHYPGASGLDGEAARHGRLRAWARTDAMGRYAFDTIRPGAYPGSDVPRHIHLHVIEPGRCTYYIGDVMFEDDARLTAAHRRDAARAPGGSGIVHVQRAANGDGQAQRDIVLGHNVPGYAGCGERAKATWRSIAQAARVDSK